MRIKLGKSFPVADEQRIEQFEKRYGIRLPPSYRSFLLDTNGGTPEHQHFVSKFYPREQLSFVVGRILPLASEDDVGYRNLESYMKTFKVGQRRLPGELLPVASDPFGNLFCLAVSGPDTGKVYFWDHEREPDDDDQDHEFDLHSAPNIKLVADNFTDFLGGLEEI